MFGRAQLLGILLLVTGCAGAHVPRNSLPPGAVVFVGAHPDDELLAAPLLQRLCVEERRRCVLLILTQGESGHCGLPDGCTEGMAQVRRREMEASARRLHAQLHIWDWGDERVAQSSEVLKGWASRTGGKDAAEQRLEQALRHERPGLLVTFDPRHGTTCHPAHRVAGWLALVAAERAGIPTIDGRFVLGTRRERAKGLLRETLWLGLVPVPENETKGAVRWTASKREWQAFEDVLALHPSQFPAPEGTFAQLAPAEARQVVLLPAAGVPADALERDRTCTVGTRY